RAEPANLRHFNCTGRFYRLFHTRYLWSSARYDGYVHHLPPYLAAFDPQMEVAKKRSCNFYYTFLVPGNCCTHFGGKLHGHLQGREASAKYTVDTRND